LYWTVFVPMEDGEKLELRDIWMEV
jgi:hypothetical protein